MLTIPILVIVALFMAWVLIKLTINALPFFTGVTIFMSFLGSGHGVAVALVLGCLAAIAVVALGKWAFAHARSPATRFAVAAAFAVPAAIAAFHAMRGIAALALPGSNIATAMAVLTAILIGWFAVSQIAQNGVRRYTASYRAS